MHFAIRSALIAFSISSLVPVHADSNWPRWRGPRQDGHYEGPAIPVKWSANDVEWKAPLKGRGQSTPILWGERIFMTTASEDGRQRSVFCLDRNGGKLLWEREVSWKGTPEKLHAMNCYASPTCVTDGEIVAAFFGRGGLHCFDLDGKPLWSHDLGTFEGPWGTAASPVIVGDLVVQNCDADVNAFLVAFDKKSGAERWRTKRPDWRGWSTPILIEAAGRQELVLNGHETLSAYEPTTGKLLWSSRNERGRGEPTVTPGKDLLYNVCGLGGAMYAVRPGGSGDVTASRVAWTAPRRGGRDLPSAILLDKHLLVSNMPGVLSCYDALSGKELFKERLSSRQISASPIATAGLAYFINEAGETLVVKPGPKLEIVARNTVSPAGGEIFRATITPSDGQLFIRSDKSLYCVGKRAKMAN
jgi:outer membrane protein assembly factor BamB